jgi:hypothetical protein
VERQIERVPDIRWPGRCARFDDGGVTELEMCRAVLAPATRRAGEQQQATFGTAVSRPPS